MVPQTTSIASEIVWIRLMRGGAWRLPSFILFSARSLFGSRRQLSDLSSHGFSARDDFVEHSVKRPVFLADIIGDHPTADGIECADSLMIHFGQSGIP